MSLGKILTTDNLRKYGIICLDWNQMCMKDGEYRDNLFLHCEVTKTFWDKIFGCSGISWVMPRKVVDILACSKGIMGG